MCTHRHTQRPTLHTFSLHWPCSPSSILLCKCCANPLGPFCTVNADSLNRGREHDGHSARECLGGGVYRLIEGTPVSLTWSRTTEVPGMVLTYTLRLSGSLIDHRRSSRRGNPLSGSLLPRPHWVACWSFFSFFCREKERYILWGLLIDFRTITFGDIWSCLDAHGSSCEGHWHGPELGRVLRYGASVGKVWSPKQRVL